jgi:uncharacterized membrane protein
MATTARRSGLGIWVVPLSYMAGALVLGLTMPRFETRIFPGLFSPMSVSSAIAIYSAIASGMIALTGIVFSLTFVMAQFSATAYSPRLVLWLSRSPVIAHSLGVFSATFLYAISALAGVDRNGSGKVPITSVLLVVLLLVASVGMFVALIERIGLLQINRMLIFTGDRGREVIEAMYPLGQPAGAAIGLEEYRALSPGRTLVYRGRPQSIQSVDVAALVRLARSCGGVIEMKSAIGDTVVEMTPLLQVWGVHHDPDEKALQDAIELGGERTFEQDPKYAIRLLVDIAIRALSPAVNDPTTAVQALDQIEDLLLRIGQRHLDMGEYRDAQGRLRLVLAMPSWEDLLLLAFDEIRAYGATSVQVMRRMKALVSDLGVALPEARQAPLRHWSQRIDRTIARSYQDEEEQNDASVEDRQGLGAPRRHTSAASS